MRDARFRIMLAFSAAVLLSAACNDSLAVREDLAARVEYLNATYTLTLESGNGSYGSVNVESRTVHNDEAVKIVATPVSHSRALFSSWSVEEGEAEIDDPYSESATASLNGAGATIRANFIAPDTRAWAAIASSDSGQYLYAAETYGQVYASSNYGETWRLLRGSPESTYFIAIACDASGQRLAGAGNGQPGLYVSADYGKSWTVCDPELPEGETAWNWIDVALDDAGSRIVAANQGGAVYTSADFGVTWVERGAANGLPSGDEQWTSVASDASGLVISAAVYGGDAYRSTDGGASWSVLYDFSTHYNDIYLSESADGSRSQVARKYNAIYTTNVTTQGWYNSSNALGWVAIDSDDSGQHVIVATFQGAIWTSDNYGNGDYVSHSGSTVGLPASGTSAASWSGVCSDGTGARLAACASGSNVYVSSDQGATWSLGL